MRKYNYDYTVFPDNSPRAFKYTCNMIEEYMPELTKEKLLIDVDGSTIQAYTINEGEIVVYDDYDVGAVYVLSDFNLDSIFSVKIDSL